MKSHVINTKNRAREQQATQSPITRTLFKIPSHLLVLDLNALLNAVGLALIDLLARLGNRPEDLVVGKRRLGRDDGGLLFEGDFVLLDACRWGLAFVIT